MVYWKRQTLQHKYQGLLNKRVKSFLRLSFGSVRTTHNPTVAQKCHGNLNLITATPIQPRQFQFDHGNLNPTAATFQFYPCNFNLIHGSSCLATQSAELQIFPSRPAQPTRHWRWRTAGKKWTKRFSSRCFTRVTSREKFYKSLEVSTI